MKPEFTATAMLALIVLLAGCSDEETARATTPDPVANSAPAPADAAPAAATPTTAAARTADPHVAPTMPAPTQQVAASNEGTVITHRVAGSYSYLEVERGGQRLWLASNRVDARPGQIVRWGDAAVMRDFYSKTLNHTFDRVLFVSQVLVASAPRAAAPAAAPEGRVVSITNGGGYSFIEVATSSGSTWLAAPQQPIKSGDPISWRGGALMRNFASKSLNRSFAEIVFVDGVTVVK